MALQSSGPISLSDIATEQGISTTNISLRSMSNTAGFASPDAITEFYGYSAGITNAYYWDFQNSGEGLAFSRSSGTQYSTNADMSISLWVRPDFASTDINWMLFHAGTNATDTNNRFYLFYDYGLQRIVARYRSGGANTRGTHWPIGSGTNAAITATTGGWTGSNVGNVNSSGLAHIVLTYDSSASSGQNAFKCYWNGTELTYKVTNLTASETAFNMDYININRPNNGTGTAREAWYDNVALFHNKLLSSSEVSTLYDSGTSQVPANHSLDSDVAFVFDAENDPPTAGTGSSHNTSWSLVTDTGRSISY